MRIEKSTPEAKIHGVQPAAVAPAPQTAGPARPVERTDRVELSPEARALAARLDAGEADTLTPERIAELRRKIQDGAYDSPGTVEAVARRILESGDL